MANKKLTIGEVEKMRGEMNTAIAEAIKKFEDETGIRVGYVDVVRKRDKESEICHPCAPSDRGEVAAVNASINMEL